MKCVSKTTKVTKTKKVKRKPQKQDLTLKQEKACRKFIELSDMSAAYRFAYNTGNMLPATINRKAKELFDLGKITARVNFLRAEIAKRNDITEDKVLQEYAKLGFLDPRRFYDNEGNLIPIHKLPANVAATLTGMDVSTSFNKESDSLDTLKKIKFADKKGALDSISRTLGMFVERHEHTGKDGKELLGIQVVLVPAKK